MNNTIQTLQNQSSQEVRDFLKTNLSNPQVIDDLVNQKEVALPLLLKHKAYFEEIIKAMVSSTADLEFFMDCCLEAKFIPPYNYVEELVNTSPKGEQIYQDLMKEFPSIPVTVQLMMSLINLGKNQAALQTLLAKPELQKPEILILMLKSQMNDEALIELATDNQVVSNKILDDLAEAINKSYGTPVIPYPAKMINQVLLKNSLHGLEPEYTLKHLSSILEEPVLVKVLEIFIAKKRKMESENRYYSYRNYKEKLDYGPAFENIDPHLLRDFIVWEAPEGSKFRQNFIAHGPDHGTDNELLEIIATSTQSQQLPKVLAEVLSRSLTLIKQVNIEKFENYLAPVELADAVRCKDEDYKKRIYMYESLSSKYRPALFKTMPKEKIPQVDNSRKKSYFFESFQALKKANLEEFREALSHGYDLSQFVKDSHQSSKKTGCENLSLSHEFLVSLTKEELLQLAATPIKMAGSYRYYYHDDDEKVNSYPYRFSVAEALIMKEKIGERDAFANVDNKVAFLASSELPADEFKSIAESFQSEIFADEALLKTFLARSGQADEGTEFSSDIVEKLAKHLTAAEIRKVADIPVYNFSDYLNIKGKDGEYVVSYELISDKIKDKYSIEDTSFIQALSKRDPEYTKNLVAAYLKGNKGLSEFFGSNISIRRGKLDFFKKLDLELNSNPEEMVEKYFAKGGKLSDFRSNLLDAKESLNQYGKGREVVVDSIDLDKIPYEYQDLTGVEIKVERANFGYSWYGGDLSDDFAIPKNVHIQLITIGANINSERMDKNSIQKVLDLNVPLVLDENVGKITRLELAKKGFPGLNLTQEAQEVMNDLQTVEGWTVEICQLLEDHGLMITEELVKEFMEHHTHKFKHMQWLAGRLGSLSKYMVKESDAVRYDSYGDEDARISNEEKIEKLQSLGLQVVPDDDFQILEIKNTLKQSGGTFAPVDVSEFSLTQKSELIKFIEQEVDPRYKSLSLISSNIDTLEILTDYESMKVCYSLDEADLIRLLNVPQNMQSKKFLKAFKDLVSIGGGGFTYKVDTLKRIMPIINPGIELELTDFVNTENVNSVAESETLESISLQVMLEVETHAEAIRNNQIFLKGQKKANVFRFLRTCTTHGDRYIRDILEMINSVLNGLEGLENRVKTLKQEGYSDEDQQIITLNESISGLKSYLTEVAKMDEAKHMHDRLVKMSSFITSDPIQPLGTDKYGKFEKSKELEEALGFQLYFPKTRGDLQYLGDHNGWCVNRASSYGDNVIKRGNILVGICEKGKPSSRENVVALAHYTKNGADNYSLEQLKWSSRKQGGRSNVDATGAFKHGEILTQIKTYLKEYNAKKALQGQEE